jgi:hypothetical protein
LTGWIELSQTPASVPVPGLQSVEAMLEIASIKNYSSKDSSIIPFIVSWNLIRNAKWQLDHHLCLRVSFR